MAEGKEMEKENADMHDQRDLKKSKNDVPYYKLFAFADSADYIFMVVGMLAAVGHGLALPFMTVVFNDVINTFGKTTDSQIVHQVSKVSNFSFLFPYSLSMLLQSLITSNLKSVESHFLVYDKLHYLYY